MGVPRSVSSQQHARSMASTGLWYCPTYSNVARMLARDRSSMLARGRSSMFSRDRFVFAVSSIKCSLIQRFSALRIYCTCG